MQQQNAQLHMRHEAATHLLAEALQQRFPQARVVHTHVNEEGFICEVALECALSPADLAALEQQIALLAAGAAGTPRQVFTPAKLRSVRNWPCRGVHWSPQQDLANARRHEQIEQLDQRELACQDDALQPVHAASLPQLCGSWPGADWPDDPLSYQRGDFAEVCTGPHVEYVGEIGVCRLRRVEIVRGSAGLQRIAGRVES